MKNPFSSTVSGLKSISASSSVIYVNFSLYFLKFYVIFHFNYIILLIDYIVFHLYFLAIKNQHIFKMYWLLCYLFSSFCFSPVYSLLHKNGETNDEIITPNVTMAAALGA